MSYYDEDDELDGGGEPEPVEPDAGGAGGRDDGNNDSQVVGGGGTTEDDELDGGGEPEPVEPDAGGAGGRDDGNNDSQVVGGGGTTEDDELDGGGKPEPVEPGAGAGSGNRIEEEEENDEDDWMDYGTPPAPSVTDKPKTIVDTTTTDTTTVDKADPVSELTPEEKRALIKAINDDYLPKPVLPGGVAPTVTVQNPYFDPNADDTGGPGGQVVTVEVPAPVIPVVTTPVVITPTLTVQNPYFDPNADDMGDGTDQEATVPTVRATLPKFDITTNKVANPYFDPNADDTGDFTDQVGTIDTLLDPNYDASVAEYESDYIDMGNMNQARQEQDYRNELLAAAGHGEGGPDEQVDLSGLSDEALETRIENHNANIEKSLLIAIEGRGLDATALEGQPPEVLVQVLTQNIEQEAQAKGYTVPVAEVVDLHNQLGMASYRLAQAQEAPRIPAFTIGPDGTPIRKTQEEIQAELVTTHGNMDRATAEYVKVEALYMSAIGYTPRVDAVGETKDHLAALERQLNPQGGGIGARRALENNPNLHQEIAEAKQAALTADADLLNWKNANGVMEPGTSVFEQEKQTRSAKVALAEQDHKELLLELADRPGGVPSRSQLMSQQPELLGQIVAAEQDVAQAKSELSELDQPGFGQMALGFIPGYITVSTARDAREDDSPGGSAVTPEEQGAINKAALLDAPGVLLAPLTAIGLGGQVIRLGGAAGKGLSRVVGNPAVTSQIAKQPSSFRSTLGDIGGGFREEGLEEAAEAGWELTVTGSSSLASAATQAGAFGTVDAVDRLVGRKRGGNLNSFSSGSPAVSSQPPALAYEGLSTGQKTQADIDRQVANMEATKHQAGFVDTEAEKARKLSNANYIATKGRSKKTAETIEREIHNKAESNHQAYIHGKSLPYPEIDKALYLKGKNDAIVPVVSSVASTPLPATTSYVEQLRKLDRDTKAYDDEWRLPTKPSDGVSPTGWNPDSTGPEYGSRGNFWSISRADSGETGGGTSGSPAGTAVMERTAQSTGLSVEEQADLILNTRGRSEFDVVSEEVATPSLETSPSPEAPAASSSLEESPEALAQRLDMERSIENQILSTQTESTPTQESVLDPLITPVITTSPQSSLFSSPYQSGQESDDDSYSETVTENQIEIVPENQIEIVPENQIEIAPENQIEIAPENQIEIVPESKIEVIPESKIEIAPENKIEIAPENKIEIAPESKIEIAPESKIEIAPESKIEIAPESKIEIAPESKVITEKKIEVIPEFVPEDEFIHEKKIETMPEAVKPTPTPTPTPLMDEQDKGTKTPQKQIPNTGGVYPATVGHKAIVWIETDVDTGETQARVLDSLERPRVIARQALPSDPGFIRGQNMDVEVGIDGRVNAHVVDVSSSQTVKRMEIAEGTDIAPEAFRDTGRPAIPAGADIPMIPVEAQPVSKSRARPPSNDYLKPKSGKSARNPSSAKSRIPGEIKRFARRAKRGA